MTEFTRDDKGLFSKGEIMFNKIIPLIEGIKDALNSDDKGLVLMLEEGLRSYEGHITEPPFVVFDIDLPTHSMSYEASWKCVWIGEDFDSEDTKVIVNTPLDDEMFYQILSHLVLEGINERGGMRRGLYLNYAFSACVLKGLIKNTREAKDSKC